MKFIWHQGNDAPDSDPALPVGTIVDRENGIAIHSNGGKGYTSHGKHYSDNGYYFGKRWQCVEFVKRYYHDRFHHHMPDVWGHAKSFYDPSLKQGEMNQRRGLTQYSNGGNVKPKAEDLLVFNQGKYGHVAIISKVESNRVEIVQQNITGHTRVKLTMVKTEDGWLLGTSNKPAGWLRLPSKPVTHLANKR